MNRFRSTKMDLNIAIQGYPQTGKKTLMEQLKFGKLKWKQLPKDCVFRAHCVGVKGIDVFAWTVGGRENAIPFWREAYPSINGFIFVIGGENEYYPLNYHFITLEDRIFQYDETKNAVVMILVNKQDTDSAICPRRVQETYDKLVASNELTPGKRCVFIRGCSAVTKEGLEDAFTVFFEQMCLKKAGKPFSKNLALSSAANEDEQKDNKETPKSSSLMAISDGKLLGKFEELRALFLKGLGDDSPDCDDDDDEDGDEEKKKDDSSKGDKKTGGSKIHALKKFVKAVLTF